MGRARVTTRVGKAVAVGVAAGVVVEVGRWVEVAGGAVGVCDGAGVRVAVAIGAGVVGAGVAIGLGATAAGVRANKASAPMITIKPIRIPLINPTIFQRLLFSG